MAKREVSERSKKLIESMEKKRGYIYPEWELLATVDPEFVERYEMIYEACMNDGQELPIKYRELVPIALLAQRGFVEGVAAHIKRAMKHGATKREILDALETALLPGGAPTLISGLTALLRIEEESGE